MADPATLVAGALPALTVAALFAGLSAGARTFLAPAMLAWAVDAGALVLDGTPLGWVEAAWFRWVLTALAAFELMGDKSPRAPSRKQPPAAIARLLSGGGCGALLALAGGHPAWLGLVPGALAAIAGTWGGYALRTRLASRFGRDWPAALLEDLVSAVLALAAIAVVVG